MMRWPPSNANAAEKIDEPTNSQHTIALVLAVRNTDSRSTGRFSRRYASASKAPPIAPMAAASLGVARPNAIDPSTAAIMTASGKNDDISILKISSLAHVSAA
ncbi:hypothetical protein G6F22_021606 [Rhizopus arrhizus]|nr:hypothetical protein G6F22_021606 [Rhizopus arrhizus]